MDTDFRQNSLDEGVQTDISMKDLYFKDRIESPMNVQPDAEMPSISGIAYIEMQPTENDKEETKKVFFVDKVFPLILNTALEHKKILQQILFSLLLLVYLAYVVYSLLFRFGDEGSWRLLICTILLLMYLGWRIIKSLSVYRSFRKILGTKNPPNVVTVKKIIRWMLYFVVLTLIATYIGLTVVPTNPRNLISLGGIFVLVFILLLVSNNKKKINWHTVFWGLSLQFGFALVVLRTEWGRSAVRWVADRLWEFVEFSDKGSSFLFSENYKTFKVIFRVVPSAIVFCAAMSVLSYLGILDFIVSNIGGFLGYCLQTNPVESINAATNIFLSGTESLVFVKDYIDTLSTSHIFCIYTNGVSSIFGVPLIVFTNFGIPIEYLFTASIMSAPASLVVSKMMYPSDENKDDDDDKSVIIGTQNRPKSLVEALSTGGLQGLQLVKKVLINLLIYISLFAFVNETITWFGNRAGVEELTLGKMCSYCFWPLAFIMGVDSVDCLKVAELMGVRIFATLFLSYIQLAKYFSNKEQYNEYLALYNYTVLTSSGDIFLPNWNTTLENGVLTDRSELIATYALCGFASIPSVVMSLASFAALAPGRQSELSTMAIRGLLAGTLASYLTGCVTGLLFV
ncbi:uncharacterized transporter HI_0519-like [Ylistrum balloti]|uniref:uncharacterized transporter HI_0519-like n=1 Tax=Ylistrum balloti TaxID=509963 RepID=UPI0029059556|nr:uncharacterized transporter HI_0519-like [Ylistrum balloti]